MTPQPPVQRVEPGPATGGVTADESPDKRAAKAWFPYFYARNALAGTLVLAAFTFNELRGLESGRLDSVTVWRPVAQLVEFGGLWPSMLPFLLAFVAAATAVYRTRARYLALRGQISDAQFKAAKRAIEVQVAQDSHLFGGNHTTLQQFVLVLIVGIVIAAGLLVALVKLT